MICGRCGSENKDGAAFCEKCGLSLISTQYGTGNVMGNSAYKKPNKKIPIVAALGVLVLVLLIAGITVFLKLNSVKADEEAVALVLDEYGKAADDFDIEKASEYWTADFKNDLEEQFGDFDEKIYNGFGDYSEIARNNSAWNKLMEEYKKKLIEDFAVEGIIITKKDNGEKYAVAKLSMKRIDPSFMDGITTDSGDIWGSIKDFGLSILGRGDEVFDKKLTEAANEAMNRMNSGMYEFSAIGYLKLVKDDGTWKISENYDISDEEWDEQYEEYQHRGLLEKLKY